MPRETKPVCFISTIPSVDRICTYTPFWGGDRLGGFRRRVAGYSLEMSRNVQSGNTQNLKSSAAPGLSQILCKHRNAVQNRAKII